MTGPRTPAKARAAEVAARAGRWLTFVLVLLATLVAPSATRAEEGDPPPGPLCGIVDPLDPLFGCQPSEPPPPPPPPPPGPGPAPPPSPNAGGPTAPVNAPSAPAPTTAAAVKGAAPPRVPARARYVPNQLLVTFKKGAKQKEIAAVLKRAGVAVEETIGELGVRVVEVPPVRLPRALAQLRSSRLVANAERDAIVYRLSTEPNDGIWPEQWGLHLVGLPAAWDLTKGSSTVIVAVIDTGVDASHPDLVDAVLPGVDLVNGDGDAADDQGHGTAVAGVVAARTNNKRGQAGVCWNCSILPVKVLDANGSGSTALVADGLVEAVNRGAKVINMSLGGPAGLETLEQAVAYAVAKGAIVLAAAGNNGSSAPFYPAAYSGVISIAGTDELDRLFSWSNRGSTVRLAAPGCNVATILGGDYDHVCGTSLATPLVAGVVALALSVKPTLTRAEIENALLGSSAPTVDGVGRIDVPRMLAALGISAPAVPAPVAATSSLTLRGQLTPRAPARAFPLVTAQGQLAATLTSAAKKPLTLSVVGHEGAVLARVSGKSPLRLDHPIPAGALRLVVKGAVRTSFVLKLSFPAAPAGS